MHSLNQNKVLQCWSQTSNTITWRGPTGGAPSPTGFKPVSQWLFRHQGSQANSGVWSSNPGTGMVEESVAPGVKRQNQYFKLKISVKNILRKIALKRISLSGCSGESRSVVWMGSQVRLSRIWIIIKNYIQRMLKLIFYRKQEMSPPNLAEIIHLCRE